MGGKKTKTGSSNIGRRTGVNVLQGKSVRRQEDGIDMFEDYWTDSDSVRSDQTTLSNYSNKNKSQGVSENVSNQDSGTVSPIKPLRSSLKKPVNQSIGEYGRDSIPGVSNRKSLTFSEDVENPTFARSKMTQTSYLLDETQSSPSKNKKHLKEIRTNEDILSDSEKNSPVKKSPRKLSNTFAQNRMEDLPLSKDDRNAEGVHENKSGKKAAIKSNSRVDTAEASSTRNTTFMRLSYLTEIRRNEVSSSDSEGNSPVRRSSRKLSNTLAPAHNTLEDLPLSTNDANVALSHEIASGKKTKNKSNSKVAATEVSPSKNRTYMQKSPLKETALKKIDSSGSERNSTMGKSSRSLSNTFAQNNLEDLPLSINDASSHEIASGRNKRNSRVAGAEGSPYKNKTYMQIYPSKETGLKKIDSSLSKRSSTGARSFRSLSNTLAQNNMEDLPSSTDDANVASSHDITSGKKTKIMSNSRVAGAESSPSKNGTYMRISPFEEIGSKKIDSFRSERNSAVRTPGVLLHKLNLVVNKKKDKGRNSGGRSQHATRSHVENHKERSINRSEIAVSHERKSVRRDDVQKSSKEKSPVAFKRKLQTSKSLESSLSKSPRILNRGDKSNKRNSSDKRSSLHKAKPSEVLNQEESLPSGSDKSISSRSDKSVNRSEILVSSPKGNGQKSSTENSPRVSDHNVRHVSNSTDSHVTVDKPVHSAKRKIDFSETRKGTTKGEKPAPSSIRRSSRNRFPCLASWRNERPKFLNSSTGEIRFLGIDEGQPEDDYAYRVLKKKYKRKVQKPKAPNRKQKNIRKTTIANVVNGKKIKLNLHRPFSTCEWIKPKNDENAGYLVSKVFASQLLSFGFLDIAAHSVKDKQYSPTDNVYFVVVKGVIDAVIDETSFTFKSGDSFIVPLGNAYSLSNNTSTSALLNFCSFKMPFFKYQEEMLV